MQEVYWEKPVKIGSRGGPQVTIAGPGDALRNLESWHCREGWFYERARNKCHGALEMGQCPENARQAFIAAALDLDIAFA